MVFSEGPDRGHAWVIAIAAGVITMILSGMSKMVGILYVAVIEFYGVSRQEATLPFTFRKSLRCLAGPFVGIIAHRFSIRCVTLVGGVITTLGTALCFVAPNVTWLVVCWGGIHGLGDAFANTLFQVVVNQYFEKYRSTASGIALSGACLGSIGFSFLIEALRHEYGLQGTFLVLSGVMLHVIPAAMFLKSPSWIRNEIGNKASPKTFRESIQERPRMYVIPDDLVKSKAPPNLSTVSLNPSMLGQNEVLGVNGVPFRSHSASNLIEDFEQKLDAKTGFDNNVFAMEKHKNPDKQPLENLLSIQNVFATSKETLYDRVSSVYDLREDQKNVHEVASQKNVKIGTTDENKQSILESVKAMLRLYKNPVFVLICACMATYVFTYIPVMTCAVDYGKDKGLPESFGKYLIHALALGDIIGRLCFGWVTDKDYISIPRYMALTLALEGTSLLILPFTTTLGSYLTLLALFSMTAGSMLVRLPVLVVTHVKKEQHSLAMGCYCFASGFVPLAVPFIIGHFRDNIGSYDKMYSLMGILSIVSAGFWLIEPLLVRWNEKLERCRQGNEPL